jgi:hypothetical protein
MQAEMWLNKHDDGPIIKALHSEGIQGPIPTMFSPNVLALTIFGSIQDELHCKSGKHWPNSTARHMLEQQNNGNNDHGCVHKPRHNLRW